MIRVAIVEDEAEIREQLMGYVQRYTRQYGTAFEVKTFADGLEILEDYRPVYDLILLDIEMKHLDGMETARRIRAIVGPEVTIIIMTAYDWTAIEHEAKLAGVNLLMSKPMFKSSLISAFSKALGEKEEHTQPVQEPDYDFTGRRVLLAEDNAISTEVAVLLLESKGFQVDTAENGLRALEMFSKTEQGYYSAILMDIRMPEVDGVECTRLIKSAYPNIKVIVLTTFDDDEYVFNALRFGASGYLLKGVSVADLTNAVREVVRGGSIIAPDVASKALQMFARMAKGNLTIGVDEKQTEDLQDNEWRIIREVGAGLSNKEIAAALCLSEGTVRNYLSSILSKLELRDRTQLAIWAVQTGVAGRPFGGPQ